MALTRFLCPCWSEEQGDTPTPHTLNTGVTGGMWTGMVQSAEVTGAPRAGVLRTPMACSSGLLSTWHRSWARMFCPSQPPIHHHLWDTPYPHSVAPPAIHLRSLRLEF